MAVAQVRFAMDHEVLVERAYFFHWVPTRPFFASQAVPSVGAAPGPENTSRCLTRTEEVLSRCQGPVCARKPCDHFSMGCTHRVDLLVGEIVSVSMLLTMCVLLVGGPSNIFVHCQPKTLSNLHL